MAVISFVFLFSLVCCSCSRPASKPTIQPQKPLVERGDAIQLVCSMDCPGAEVQWEGLDTDLGNIVSNHTHSILTLTNATINMEGTKMCSGRCQGTSSLEKVELNVYSFPDTLQLDSQPETLTAGQPARLFCSMSHVYPYGALTLSWFQGDEQLEASKEMEEEEMEDSDEQLFVYHSELDLPTAAEGVAYKCKAALETEQQTLVQEMVAVAVASPRAPQENLGATGSTILTLTSGRTSQTAAPELLTTADWKSSFGTTTSLLPLVSTNHPTSGASVVTATATPMLESLTKDGNSITVMRNTTSGASVVTATATPTLESLMKDNSITVMRNATRSSYPTDQEFTTKPLSTTNCFLTESASVKPTDPCHPMIIPVPAEGITGDTLRITCQAAECSKDVQIRWVETPVAQSQYHLEEAEGQSTLMVESVRLEHQGIYRCVAVASQPRIASLHVIVSPAIFKTYPLFTIGATGSLLGLIITGYASHRWWQRRRR